MSSFLGTTQAQSAIADILINDVAGLQTALDGKVDIDSAQALHATDALSISGNVVTLSKANGTSETITLPSTSVTTAQVLAATAGATAGVVGTYIFANQAGGVNWIIGRDGTSAGSALASTSAAYAMSGSPGGDGMYFTTAGGLAGTWRCMGTYNYMVNNAAGGAMLGATLWLRIS